MLNLAIYGKNELIRLGLKAIFDAQDDVVVAENSDRFPVSRGADFDVALISDDLLRTSESRLLLERPGSGVPRMTYLLFIENPSRAELGLCRLMLQSGCSGIVTVTDSASSLVLAARSACAGHHVTNTSVMRSLLDNHSQGEPGNENLSLRISRLTNREVDVVSLTARGKSNSEIAAALFIGESTAKTHLNRAMAKLDASSRAAVVGIAYEAGIVVPHQ